MTLELVKQLRQQPMHPWSSVGNSANMPMVIWRRRTPILSSTGVSPRPQAKRLGRFIPMSIRAGSASWSIPLRNGIRGPNRPVPGALQRNRPPAAAGLDEDDLLAQPSIRNLKQSVQQLLEGVSRQVNEAITIKRTVRWSWRIFDC